LLIVELHCSYKKYKKVQQENLLKCQTWCSASKWL